VKRQEHHSLTALTLVVLAVGLLLPAGAQAATTAPLMDANVTVNGHGTVTTPSFNTAEAGEQLLAFVSSDGPSGAGKQSATVSGAGLTWTLVKRASSQSGDAEIWSATAPNALAGATVTSIPAAGGFDQSLAVISMERSTGIGASVTGGAASGAPSVSLSTTGEGSLVYAVGHDWDKATARTLGPNQTMLHQYLDTATGDTSWSQYTSLATGPAGSVVTLNDTAPTNDQWDVAAVEILGGGKTAPAPGQVTGVTATAGAGAASLIWKAPSSGGAPTKYTITPYIGTTAQPATAITGAPPATGATITGLTPGTSYTFTVTASNSGGSGPASEHSNAVTPGAEPIAYPDLQLLMPTSEFSIIHTATTRTLEFTHITWDAGEGPWELRPSYNEATGISQGYQALYTMPSPGVWKFARTVPIAGPMIWTPPSDYNFPLDKFSLYSAASSGGLGSLVATSPKDLFCMTSDTFVGGVPNAPGKNGYPSAACNQPEGTLGLTVGWGDKYEATDGGEGIEISSLANGTYWLQGEVDPDHYFEESNTSNNLTDTKIKIEGDTVTVLEQTHPSSTPPTVTLASPSPESTLSGTATLTATASGPAPISSVQFLLDGEPIGSPVTSAPYTLKWAIGSTTPGKHFLSAQATDSNGFVGTAADVPVTTLASEEEKSTEPPSVAIVNPVAGQQASGVVQVSANVSDKVAIKSVQFYLDGKALGAPVTAAPYAISWDTTTATNGAHKLTATATDTSGNAGTSTPVEVTVKNPAYEGPCFVIDANVTVNGHGTTTTQSFTTAEGGEQLFAFVGSDGPAGAGKQSVTVSGAGLSWKLVARANTRSGDAEIWTARSLTPLLNETVTSTPALGGYDQSLTVISMEMSDGAGASATAGAASGAPSVSLKTTESEDLVFGVGNDYDNATVRTLGSNQVMLSQYLNTKTGDTYWSQYTGAVTGAAGSTVTLNDTAPTGDQWNMAAVEVLGDGPGD
jgi:hypothetical protein